MNIVSTTGQVLWESKKRTVREALVEAAKAGADLAGADLTGADLAGANLAGVNLAGANLVGADLAGARLAGARLVGANLAGVNLAGARLVGANLVGADLVGADLTGADLAGVNLAGVNLAGAVGINPYRTTPLHILTDQVGKIRAYKLVTLDGQSPIHDKRISYAKGETVEAEADTNPANHCGPGINVATLDWCLSNWRPGWRVLVVEFTARDIAAIPHGSDGKFRVHRCKVVGEKSHTDLGLA